MKRKPKREKQLRVGTVSVERLSFAGVIVKTPITLAGMLPPEQLPGPAARYVWPKPERNPNA